MPFIISCGHPWYQRQGGRGMKADRERSEVNDGRMEGGIRGRFNNLGWFLPTNQMNKRGGYEDTGRI